MYLGGTVTVVNAASLRWWQLVIRVGLPLAQCIKAICFVSSGDSNTHRAAVHREDRNGDSDIVHLLQWPLLGRYVFLP